MVELAFNQADLNRDGVLNSGEFGNFLGQRGIGNGASYGSNGGFTGGYESSSSYQSTTGGYGATGGYGGANGYGSNGFSGSSGYESSGVSGGAGYGSSGYDASGASGTLGYGSAGLTGDAAYNSSSSQYSSSTAVQSYPTDSRGLFQDNNPQIIRRPAPGGNLTYTQNIRVRFLQPPPVPPPGVSRFLLL